MYALDRIGWRPHATFEAKSKKKNTKDLSNRLTKIHQ